MKIPAHITIALMAIYLLAAPGLMAQDLSESCSLGDAQCIEAQMLRQCASRVDATVQSCEVWIQATHRRSGAGDVVATRYIALAHVLISLRTLGEEAANHQSAARAIFAELVDKDPSDVDALVGLSSVARDLHERIELLRRIMSLSPLSYNARMLADALVLRNSKGDVLEAAEVLDANYRRLPVGVGWDVAARAVALYERAGMPMRNEYFRVRIGRELDPGSLISEVRNVPTITPVQAGQILQKLCDANVVAVLGASPCVEGLREMTEGLMRLSGGADAREFGEMLAKQVLSHAGVDSGLITGDPGWQSAISEMFREMETARIESPAILLSRSRLIERDPLQRLRLLDRASQLVDPNDGAALQELANDYMSLLKRGEALALLRRLRQLPTTTEPQLQIINHNIEALENAERASKEASETR